MPIFRVGEKLHYYAHVPKCGGSSVEGYLKDRFGSLAFLNTQFLSVPETHRWSKSSPQHLPLADFHRLVPKDWISSSFAVVRHPLRRLISAYHFQRDVENTVSAIWTIDEWFDDYLQKVAADPFMYDGHLRPMSEIVPEEAEIFKLEDGLAAIVPYLDRIAGDQRGDRDIAPENVAKKSGSHGDAAPSPETLAKVAQYYAEDFRRFGYDPEKVTKSAKPKAAPSGSGLLRRLKSKLARR